MNGYMESMSTLEEIIKKGEELRCLRDQLIQEIEEKKLVAIRQEHLVEQLLPTQKETLLKILAQQQLIVGSPINKVYGDNVLSHLPEDFKASIRYALQHEREIIENFLEIREEDDLRISITFRHVPKSVSTDVTKLLRTFAFNLYTAKEKEVDPVARVVI